MTDTPYDLLEYMLRSIENMWIARAKQMAATCAHGMHDTITSLYLADDFIEPAQRCDMKTMFEFEEDVS